MNKPLKGYLYFTIGALLLIIALPALLSIILLIAAAFFLVSGASILKDNIRK